MKLRMLLALSLLFSASSKADNVLLSITFSEEAAPPIASALEVEALLADGPDGQRRIASLGLIPATMGSNQNGTVFANLQIPRIYFDAEVITSLSIGGFSEGCTLGFIPITYPVSASIYPHFNKNCKNYEATPWPWIGPFSSGVPAGSVSSPHIGNTNASRDAALRPLFGGCLGTCNNSSEQCLIADVRTIEKWIGFDFFPWIRTIPANRTTVSFIDTTGNGIPDTYKIDTSGTGSAEPKADPVKVICQCLDPAGAN